MGACSHPLLEVALHQKMVVGGLDRSHGPLFKTGEVLEVGVEGGRCPLPDEGVLEGKE